MALNITTPVACEANTFGDPPPWTHGRTVSELSSTPPEGHDAFGSAIRLHVDNGILGLFDDDLKASENHWRNLYYERVRCGNNTELWFTTRAVAFMAKAIIAQSKDAGQRHLYTLFCRLAMEEKLLPFLEDVVSQDDFYAEYPDFVMSILDIVIALLSTSRSEPSLFARVRRIIVSLCNTSWNRRTLLVDDPTVDQFYPAGRRGVRHQLYLVMMAVIRPTDFAARFGYGHEIRRTSFLCWYLCPDIELDNIAYSAAMLDHGIMGRPTETYWGQELHRTMKSVEEVMELDVLPAIGARPYLERLLKMLQCDVLIDGSLDLAITGALMSFHSSTALLANLAPSGVFKAIIQAVDRQALQGKPGMLSKPMCELLGMYSVIISKSIMHAVPELQPAISAFIRDGRIVEIHARALRVCVIEEQSAGLTYQACSQCLQTFKACTMATNQLSSKNSLRKTIRQGFREHWYPTLEFLRQTRERSTSVKEHESVTGVWKRLGEEVGFEESVQKAEYERELKKTPRHCGWKDCRYHKEKPPAKLQSCKGCAEVRYCSKPCQRKDWYDGHKALCKRLK